MQKFKQEMFYTVVDVLSAPERVLPNWNCSTITTPNPNIDVNVIKGQYNFFFVGNGVLAIYTKQCI